MQNFLIIETMWPLRCWGLRHWKAFWTFRCWNLRYWEAIWTFRYWKLRCRTSSSFPFHSYTFWSAPTSFGSSKNRIGWNCGITRFKVRIWVQVGTLFNRVSTLINSSTVQARYEFKKIKTFRKLLKIFKLIFHFRIGNETKCDPFKIVRIATKRS